MQVALVNDYRMFVELHDQSGRTKHQFEIETVANCVRDIEFSALCEGRLSHDSVEPCCRLEPIWERKGESPYCTGFRLSLTGSNGQYRKEYGKAVFKYQVYRVVSEMLKQGQVKEGTQLQYRLSVFDRQTLGGGQTPSRVLPFQTVHEPLAIVEGCRPPSRGASDDPVNMEIWIADHVVDEIVEYALQNKQRECAGFLLGKLCRDRATGRVFAVCSAQIIARCDPNQPFATESSSSLTHFQFSPELFFEAQRMIDLRKQGELVLGWHHSHPWPFNCEKGDQCQCTSVFFSTADFQVMEAAFDSPYQVAIVVGRASLKDMKATAQMYGWQAGLVEPRSFHRFDAGRQQEFFQLPRKEESEGKPW